MLLRRLTLLGFCLCLLVLQEYALSFVPQVQISTLLLLIYSKNFNFKEMFILLVSYVLLDNLLMGTFRIEFVLAMFISWFIYVFINKTIFKNEENELKLALTGAIFAFIYSWAFVGESILVLEVKFLEYLLLDIPFEIALAIVNFVTIYWLYQPLNQFFKKQLNN